MKTKISTTSHSLENKTFFVRFEDGSKVSGKFCIEPTKGTNSIYTNIVIDADSLTQEPVPENTTELLSKNIAAWNEMGKVLTEFVFQKLHRDIEQSDVKTISLTKHQLLFLKCALSVKESVLPVTAIDDKTFEDDYGVGKEDIITALNDLVQQLK